jgi:phytanoyl-CoA hydroxylase
MNFEFYRRNGYWVEEQVFTEDECRIMISASKKLGNYLDGTFGPQMMPHQHRQIFYRAMAHPKITVCMDEIVQGMTVGLQTEFFYCKPGTKGFSMHQDNYFVEAPAGAFASAWIPLVDTFKGNGGLYIVPGTHQLGLLPVRDLETIGQKSQDPNARKIEAVVPEGSRPVHLIVNKGSVVFLDGYLVHGSNDNLSQEWRYTLLCTYLRRGEPFRPGRYANRKPIDL